MKKDTKEDKTVTLQIKMDATTHKEIEKAAKRIGLNKSGLVRMWLKEKLREQEEYSR